MLMANEEHVNRLKQDMKAWNVWSEGNLTCIETSPSLTSDTRLF